MEYFDTCVAVINDQMKFLGDINRLFVQSEDDMRSVLRAIEKAQRRFEELNIPRVKTVELFPGISEVLIDEFSTAGYRLSEHTYFALQEIQDIGLNIGNIKVPSTEEYMRWYEVRCREYDDFDENWWSLARTQRPDYIKIFRPYWSFVEGVHVGYMYCAETEEYTCVHDINILPTYRGKGYGFEMVYKAIQNKRKPIVLRAGQSMKRFYGKMGFVLACRNKVVEV